MAQPRTAEEIAARRREAQDKALAELRTEYLKRRTRQRLAVPGFTLAAILLTLLPGNVGFGRLALIVAMVVALMVFALVNWRCPKCNAYFDRGFSKRFCSNCGTHFEP